MGKKSVGLTVQDSKPHMQLTVSQNSYFPFWRTNWKTQMGIPKKELLVQ